MVGEVIRVGSIKITDAKRESRPIGLQAHAGLDGSDRFGVLAQRKPGLCQQKVSVCVIRNRFRGSPKPPFGTTILMGLESCFSELHQQTTRSLAVGCSDWGS